MYAKLALRNMRRSIKDYLIYFITLTLCVGLFYAFLSLSSSNYQTDLPPEYNLSMLYYIIEKMTFFITALLIFLIKYVNNYMISRKRKEFALHTIMGMEQKTTALLFFIETLIMGIVSILAGILLGILFAQVVTALILQSLGQPYTIYISLYPDTALTTLSFFIFIFVVIGLFNVKTIRKIKIIDMLNDNKKTEVNFHTSKGLRACLILLSILALVTLTIGLTMYGRFYDNRFDLMTRITFIGVLITPILFVLFNLIYSLYAYVKRKKHQTSTPKYFQYLVSSLVIISLSLSFFSLKMRLFLGPLANEIIDIGEKNLFVLPAIIFLIFAVYGFYYCLSSLILWIKNKFLKAKYKEDNLFLFGQLTAKLQTTSTTMSAITLTLMTSLILLVLAPILSNWAMGYLEQRAIFDIQVSTSYASINEFDKLPTPDYGHITDYVTHQGYRLENAVQAELYFIDDQDFYRRRKTDFPVLAMSLSDYNDLRALANFEPIELSDHEFTTQWYSTASEESISDFLLEHPALSLGNISLSLSTTPYHQDSLGESIYNFCTDITFIIPDKYCENLTSAKFTFGANVIENIPYDFAGQLENYIEEYYLPLDSLSGNITYTDLKTLSINESTSGALSVKLLLIYSGIVLIIICFTTLSLQQLSDSVEHRGRFSVLRKIGVDKAAIDKLILKQMSIWFGIPILTALIGTVVGIHFVINSNFDVIMTYVGKDMLLLNIGVASGIIIFILVIYFVITAILFKRNVNEYER